MTPVSLPLTRELVLIGGGHSHALVLKKWGMHPLPGARLTLINPGPTAPYTGMLPGHVAGHYHRDDLMIDLVRLARFAGARLILGAVSGIDRATRRIVVPGRAPVAYDIASINTGITSDPLDLPGFAAFGIAAKPLGAFAAAWDRFRAQVVDGTVPPDVVMIGAGVGGIELALAMRHGLQQAGAGPRITVLDQANALPGLSTGTRATLLAELQAQNIELIENANIVLVAADAVHLQDGRHLAAGFTVGVAGARAADWLESTGLHLHHGFVTVDRYLQSSDPAIFAAGDIAHLPDPRPKAGVFAVREAPVLAHNLRAALTGDTPKPYRPQRDYLKLISLGGRSALADKYGGRLKGAWLWRWKDRIDRRFMDQFANLKPMPAPAVPRQHAKDLPEALGDKPMCGGCGAKVGAATLAATLTQLPQKTRADVLSQPGDDAAVLQLGDTRQVLTTDHLRALTEDPWQMARIAAIHALGDIWAMGAQPQAALATVILPRLSDRLQGEWLSEIIGAAAEVFAEAGAEITGGHTSIGSELTLGFTITGLLDGPAITLAGAKPGDALVLSKPIGSGTLMAAEMALQARGDWVAETLIQMTQTQGAAAQALAHAHAMTDVTGFGLAGHLLAICKASNIASKLNLRSIPKLPGAQTLANLGVRSSLYPANKALLPQMPDSPETALLFDPQTAGGLLAAIPADSLTATLQALHDQGYRAAHIGQITDGPPGITT